MLEEWPALIINFALLSLLLLGATLLRSRLKPLQNLLIPNSITAGFLGLILGSQLLGLFDIPLEELKSYIYHLLGITFIAISLKRSEGVKVKDSLRTSFCYILGYGLQALSGLGLALLIFSRLFPGFAPTSGLLVQLGFSFSPAAAYNIAHGWEKVVLAEPALGESFAAESGISYGGDIGLTFGAIGFLVACLVGVILINYGRRRGLTQIVGKDSFINEDVGRGIVKDAGKQAEAGSLTTHSEAVDSLSFHIALVLAIYIATFFLLKALGLVINLLPEALAFLAGVVIQFHFIFAALLAMLVRRLITLFRAGHLLNNGLCERVAGVSVDYMVTASIAAISLSVTLRFIVPILIISLAATVVTFLYCIYFGSRTFESYKFERIVAIFGVATGTMATGLALLRVLDPDFKSPVASEMMYGAGLAFLFSLPIMVFINLPLRALVTGAGYLNWLALLFTALYIAALLVVWRVSSLISYGGSGGKLYKR